MGQWVGYSSLLRAGRPGGRIPRGGWVFCSRSGRSGAHLGSCSMVNRSVSGGTAAGACH